MSGFEIALEGFHDDAALVRALARAYEITSDEVSLLESIQEFDFTNVRLIVQKTFLGGEFPTHLAIHTHLAPETDSALSRRICAELATRAVISDDSVNPWTWLLVTPDGEVRSVWVDAESLDDRGEFRIDWTYRAASGSEGSG